MCQLWTDCVYCHLWTDSVYIHTVSWVLTVLQFVLLYLCTSSHLSRCVSHSQVSPFLCGSIDVTESEGLCQARLLPAGIHCMYTSPSRQRALMWCGAWRRVLRLRTLSQFDARCIKLSNYCWRIGEKRERNMCEQWFNVFFVSHTSKRPLCAYRILLWNT